MIMPISHIFEEFSCYDLICQIPQNATEQLGLLLMSGPGTFMMCLGFGIVFSKKSTPKKLFLRGLSMFGIQMLLNLFRFTLPHQFAAFALSCPDLINDGIDFFLYSDILPFAGFTFIFFAIVKFFNISNIVVLLFGLFCTTTQMLIPQISFNETVKNLLCGYFFYIDETSFFPFISWIIYPICGYLLGNNLVKSQNKKQFYLTLGGISFILFLVINLFLIINGTMQKDFYLFMETGFRMDLPTTLIVSCFIGIYTCIIYFISTFIKDNFAKHMIATAKNINSIYCIHWVIVKWLWAFALVYTTKIEYYAIFGIGIGIFFISAFIAQLWKNQTKKFSSMV